MVPSYLGTILYYHNNRGAWVRDRDETGAFVSLKPSGGHREALARGHGGSDNGIVREEGGDLQHDQAQDRRHTVYTRTAVRTAVSAGGDVHALATNWRGARGTLCGASPGVARNT